MAFRKIEARYVITTPMYLGGHASNVASERMREASFKGALRFWWRALMWNEAWQKEHGNEDRALSLLRQWEGQLFGVAAEKGKDSRASMFRLRCSIHNHEEEKTPDTLEGAGWQYLKGQGLDRRMAAFAPETKITAVLLLHPQIATKQVDQLLKALVALGLFGGIGARSRRGVGSVAIQSLNINEHPEGVVPHNINELPKTLEWMGVNEKNLQCPLPPFAAFSIESRVDWVNLNISEFGCQFMNWRGYYERDCRKIKEKPKKKQNPIFKQDHDNMMDVANGIIPPYPPKRSVFGLPHNYFFKSIFEKLLQQGFDKRAARKMASVYVNYGSAFYKEKTKHERHASPLLVHFHDLHNIKGVILTFLPSRFVEDQLAMKGRKVVKKPFQPDWKVVRNFMDHMGGKTL